MAKIVIGMGTSHGPMLSTPPDQWHLRVADDRRNRQHYRGRTWTYDELAELRRSQRLDLQITPQVWRERHAACRIAIASMAAAFAAVKPDIAVIVGNDQMEIFGESLIPAFSVLHGETIINSMYPQERLDKMPPGIAVSVPGHIPPGGAVYPSVPDLGRHIVETAIEDGFDVAAMTRFPRDETPHAFGFVFRQIMNDAVVPTVPVLVNTFYPPNQPRVTRCYDFGKSIVRAIRSWDQDLRVALIASGGLTHFVIDEEVDQTIMEAMREGRVDKLAALGEPIFQAGTSEVKNWIPVAGAMADLKFDMTVVDYVPCYRSEAGTGNAMAFVYWLPGPGPERPPQANAHVGH